MSRLDDRFSAKQVLKGLKDFQVQTVDYVFSQLFIENKTTRFLVADEVGLGKTLVARGLIARALEHLQDTVERVDIVYVCSNSAIASQNVNRLNVTGKKEFTKTTRLTMLPLEVHHLTANKVNFVSFTPGTTFDLKSRGGVVTERALLYRMVKGAPWDYKAGLYNILQGAVRNRKNWKWEAKSANFGHIDPELANKFQSKVQDNSKLVDRLSDCCTRFAKYRHCVPPPDHELRYSLIGELRLLLARTCLDALEPDLVILDEFQRFKSLLDGEDDGAHLARELFNYPEVKTLLLSATPYKMLSLDHEQDDDHYPDFLRTLRFLLNDDDEEVEKVRHQIRNYRTGLYKLAGGRSEDIAKARDALQASLMRVMCRTERVGMTERLDAMLLEQKQPAPIEPADLDHALVIDQAARAVGARDPMEYWKSSPYALNFMKNYQLRRLIDEGGNSPPKELLKVLHKADGSLLNPDLLENYQEVGAANPRLRVLLDDTLNKDQWRLLWMPASLPYTVPAGPYEGIPSVTKALVFSSWNLVPDSISVMATYEAERRMVKQLGKEFKHKDLYERLKPLLRFAVGREGRLTGMPALAWMLPSAALTNALDPLRVAVSKARQGEKLTADQLVAHGEKVFRKLLKKLPLGKGSKASRKEGKRSDERWYWAAPVLLESGDGLCNWLNHSDNWSADQEAGDRFGDHISHLAEVGRGEIDLGPQPADLPRVLAELSLAGPGNCALRALKRICPDMPIDDPQLLSAATQIASGFRTLFNLPESIALLRGGGDEAYWRLALKYSLEGNLQAVLDEQAHLLVEQLGLIDYDEEERVKQVSKAFEKALSIRTSQVSFDELRPNRKVVERKSINMRCRYALRFGDLRDDRDQNIARADTVRDAFNSPFRPFVLASTSIGQEGLDFHTWCHAVVHWNLPSNPVDLEQREGRVHRYKGHAVRKNIAEHYGLGSLVKWNGYGDPWQLLFERAKEDRPSDSSDLIPFWIFEQGSAKVERRVPLIPFSREEGQLERLKRSLALYRLVFGQPRQEDLLTHLTHTFKEGEAQEQAQRWRISLAPPKKLHSILKKKHPAKRKAISPPLENKHPM